MLANRMIAKRWKAVTLMGAGILATVVACESRLPNDVAEPNEAVQQEKTRVPQTEERRVGLPMKTDMLMEDGRIALTGPDAMELVDKYYPPLLRKAGIGGFAVVRLTLHENGRVDGYTVTRSAGHEALDETALRVAKELKMLPTLRDNAPGPQEYNLVITFDPRVKRRQLAPTRLPLKAKGTVLPDNATSIAPPGGGIERKPLMRYDVKPDAANRADAVKR